MKDVEPAELEYLLQFIYLGEVDIPSTDLERLITISRELGIVGLNTVKNEDEETVERRYAIFAWIYTLSLGKVDKTMARTTLI